MFTTSTLRILRSQRGVISMEWLILSAVIMTAIIVTFAPTLETALSDGVDSLFGLLQSTIAAGGS